MTFKFTTSLKLLLIGLFIVIGLTTNAQTISGPSPVGVNSSYTYTYDDGTIVQNANWTVTNGTINRMWSTGTTYYASIFWTTTGTGTLSFTAANHSKSVSINTCTTVPVPTVTNAVRCTPGSLTLTAGAPGTGYGIRWYNSGSYSPVISTATSFVTPSLTSTTTYFLSKYNTTTGCESAWVGATATISTTPVATALNQAICSGQTTSIALNSTVSGTTFSWTVSQSSVTGATATSGSVIAQSLSTTTNASGTATYTVTPNASGCVGTAISVSATVKPLPSVTVSPLTQNLFSGQLSSLAISNPNNVTGTTFNWTPTISNTAGAANGSGNAIAQTLSATGSSNGTVTYSITPVANSCSGSPATATVTVYPLPVIVASQPYIVKGSTVTLDAGSGFTSYVWKNSAGTTVFSSTAAPLVSSYQTNIKDTYTLNVIKSGITSPPVSYILGSQFSNLNMNYIISNSTLIDGITDSKTLDDLPIEKVSQIVDYFDGFGRSIQHVATQSSPGKIDQVTPEVYDQFGRQPKSYLPVTIENNGRYKSGLLDASGNYAGTSVNYNNGGADLVVDDSRPFNEVVFEPSPLNRPDKSYGPGAAWSYNTPGANKYIQHQYLINQHNTGASSTQEKVIAWYVNSSGMPVRLTLVTSFIEAGGYYSSFQLSIKGTVDEQGNAVREYTNKEGQLVLKKVQVVAGSSNLNSTTDWALTYYIYDDLGNLRYVLQPELSKTIHNGADTYVVTSTDLANFAFQYTYDARKRMTQKQVPGAGLVYMVYDGRDRLVFTQDVNQRSGKYWSFTKYDILNRPVLTGIYQADSTLAQSKMQRRVNAYYNAVPGNGGAWFESYTGGATVHGYDNKSYPQETNADNYLNVTYYDHYTFRNNWPGTYGYVSDGLTATVLTIPYTQWATSTENKKVVGQVTGTKIKVLDGGVRGGYTWLRSVNYYDDRYRVIQTQTDNYKGGKDKVSNLYDFVGKVLKSKETHTVTTWTDLVGVKQDGNKIIRTASPGGWGTAGAASVQQLGAGQDGWVECVASEMNDYRLLGLSAVNTDAGYTSIDYAWDLAPSNTAYIFEKGTNRGQFTYSLGDVFRIERVGATINYYQNNILRLSSTIPSSSSLIVDLSFNNVNAELANIRTSFTNAARTITRSFDYDHTGRLLRTWHQVDDSGTNYLLSKNNYNELGQLIDKKLHSLQADASDNKQSIDHRYNIRGWLTSMNNSQLSDDHLTTNTNDDVGDLFGMNLLYNTDDNTNLGSTGLFNGNISGMKWSVGLGQGNTKELGYNFSYDAMNRLTAANSRMNKTTWQAGYYDETVPLYDLNGNIKNLTRKGDNNLQIDNLTYNYGTNSNQLQYVQDNTSNTTDKLKGFADGNTGTAIDYTYDANGNLTHDLNKGIGITTADATNLITYNFLNLPEIVTKAGNNIHYIYDASGRKLAQVVSFVNTQKQTDYVGEFQYENDVLQFINHEEGRIAMSGTKMIYSNSFTTLNADITTTTNATATTYSNNGENYIKVTTSTASNGLSQIGNASTYTVQPGDRYRVRLKGYRTTNPAYLQITAGSTILNSPGTALPNSAVTESWIEQIVTIPSGVTTMKVAVIWGTTVTANESLCVNELEVSQLTTQTPEYQYNLKDHLGNVRVTFTTQPTVDVSLATFEDAYADAKVFKNVNTSTAYWVSKSGANNTSPGQYVMRMNNTYPAGPSKTLQVFPGDVINTEVWSYFEGTSGFGSSNQTNANLILAVAAAFGGVPGGAGESGSIYNGVNSAYTTHGAPSNQGDGNPTAHLNYILFDKNYNYIDMGFQPVPSTANMAKQKIAFAPITIKEVGYIYVYLSYSGDGTNWVYFDDLKITNAKSVIIASNDYYPFGLTYNSFTRENNVPNNRNKFQDQEHVDDLGLNWDSFKWRNHQPDIGRFFNIDPLAEKYYYNSPYAFSENSVIRYIELEGLEKVEGHENAEPAEAETGDPKQQQQQTDTNSLLYKFLWTWLTAFNEGGKAINKLNGKNDTSFEENVKTMGGAVELAVFSFQMHGELLNSGAGSKAKQVIEETEAVAPSIAAEAATVEQGASFGFTTSTNYRQTFFSAYPELEGEVVVHHAVEQQTLTRYPGVVSAGEIHSLENLRGIPNALNNDIHLSQIRRAWNQFYRTTPNATQTQLLQKATELDKAFGPNFIPPISR